MWWLFWRHGTDTNRSTMSSHIFKLWSRFFMFVGHFLNSFFETWIFQQNFVSFFWFQILSPPCSYGIRKLSKYRKEKSFTCNDCFERTEPMQTEAQNHYIFPIYEFGFYECGSFWQKFWDFELPTKLRFQIWNNILDSAMHLL